MKKTYDYFLCDVFTDIAFGGNALAVFPKADGLSGEQMQKIAREFNFSESAFVFEPEGEGDKKVRIFTPTREVPFAGHPNVGTAFVLAESGVIDLQGGRATVVFEELAGLVSVDLMRHDNGMLEAKVRAPEQLSLGEALPVERIAEAVSLSTYDICVEHHQPQVISVGLPFLCARVSNLPALQRARPNVAAIEQLESDGIVADIHLYTHLQEENTLQARMFAPLDGVPEDPATGSANAALAGLLAHLQPADSGHFEWSIKQGMEMHKPSLIKATAVKQANSVTEITIAGTSVMLSEGRFFIE
ncbi:PhzF family phenazine biosynthesis protein [Marinicella sp. W31]|uniref:PhzF family phenazine biosynthesis protein n=1 Tax=Marinicella sp. W31 TaxID=3023713 RepID=UPI00375808C7